MRKVIFDTNFLMVPVQLKIDIYSIEGELYTLESCINELKRLSKERTRRGMQSKAALELLNAKGVCIIKNTRRADKTLIEYSGKGYIIATNDKALIKQLKELGHNVIRIRQKKMITEE